MVWTNFVRNPDFVRLFVGIFILIDVFLRKQVDVVVRVVRDLNDLTPNRDETVRVLRIRNAECHFPVPPHILVFDAAFCTVDADVRAVVIAPDGGYLGCSVFHQCSEMGERFLFEKVTELVRDFSHVSLL